MSSELDPTVDARQVARELLEGRPATSGVRKVKSALEDLAQQGDVEAQNLLGAIELEIEKKPERARHWFEMTAAKGDPAGQRSLGHLYAIGIGVKSDMPRAVELFRAAATGGDAFAMYNLAMANIDAEGEYLTFDETLSLLEKSADGGVVQAEAKIGDLLAQVDRDSEALNWYVKAASHGHTGAMNAAACWFRDGTAGEADPVQAVRWFLSMLDNGNGDGIHQAIELARTMTNEQIREAARLAGRTDEGEALILTVAR